VDLRLIGKTAIVTGGSAGIGLACATTLYEEGVSVVIVARNHDRLAAAARSIASLRGIAERAEVIPMVGDMSKAEDIERVTSAARDRFSRIDILVNNAGAAPAGAFLSLSDQTYYEAWTLKLLGYIRMVRAVAPHMMAQRDGRIVNIVGTGGRTPESTFLAGSTANAALLNFTRGVSKFLAPYNVRINAISPGSTATERAERLAAQRAAAAGVSVDEEKAAMVRSIPLGRMVDPTEIAAMAVLLVSDRVGSMTGTEVIIDGGHSPSV
jgi:NAD(P)-dependent dehydrogenase (short-subunit alcohol dehydrogenase family)